MKQHYSTTLFGEKQLLNFLDKLDNKFHLSGNDIIAIIPHRVKDEYKVIYSYNRQITNDSLDLPSSTK